MLASHRPVTVNFFFHRARLVNGKKKKDGLEIRHNSLIHHQLSLARSLALPPMTATRTTVTTPLALPVLFTSAHGHVGNGAQNAARLTLSTDMSDALDA